MLQAQKKVEEPIEKFKKHKPKENLVTKEPQSATVRTFRPRRNVSGRVLQGTDKPANNKAAAIKATAPLKTESPAITTKKTTGVEKIEEKTE